LRKQDGEEKGNTLNRTYVRVVSPQILPRHVQRLRQYLFKERTLFFRRLARRTETANTLYARCTDDRHFVAKQYPPCSLMDRIMLEILQYFEG
jgi:hypothetical protein